MTGFAIKLSGGALEPAGEIFDTAPYGWPVAKGSPLGEALRQALEHVMSTGEYKAIATQWGVEKGMISKPVINGAIPLTHAEVAAGFSAEVPAELSPPGRVRRSGDQARSQRHRPCRRNRTSRAGGAWR